MLIVDLSKVKFIDSIALGSLVVLLRRVKATDGRLAMTGLSGHSRRVLQVTGLDNVLDLFDGTDTAMAEFQGHA
jgi:anti-sigma B factor antagonist